MDTTDCIVIGAGVVGLAIARHLAMSGREVIVLEKENAIAMHSSSRNSEVIHAGIYYLPGSLKAKLCVRGKSMLYEFCENKGVAHQRVGKLIVATQQGQIAALERLHLNGQTNGVGDLRMLETEEAQRMEPMVRFVRAMLSPSTGIVDSHGLILAMQGDLEDAGGMLALNTEVVDIRCLTNGFELKMSDDYLLRCDELVNAAGLWAPQTAALIDCLDDASVPTPHFAKGHYFSYAGPSPFSHLIYPMPNNAGLGTHATLDIGGAVRFGPDVSWVDSVEYSFDESRRERFCKDVVEYYPDMDVSRLQPGYTGIRSKIVGPDQPPHDFLIQHEEDHGIAGLVNLLGIDSPGLTSSLAIAEIVAARLDR